MRERAVLVLLPRLVPVRQLGPGQCLHPPPELGLLALLLDDAVRPGSLQDDLLEEPLAFRPRLVHGLVQLRVLGAHPVRNHAGVAKCGQDERDLARCRGEGDEGG